MMPWDAMSEMLPTGNPRTNNQTSSTDNARKKGLGERVEEPID